MALHKTLSFLPGESACISNTKLIFSQHPPAFRFGSSVLHYPLVLFKILSSVAEVGYRQSCRDTNPVREEKVFMKTVKTAGFALIDFKCLCYYLYAYTSYGAFPNT